MGFPVVGSTITNPRELFQLTSAVEIRIGDVLFDLVKGMTNTQDSLLTKRVLVTGVDPTDHIKLQGEKLVLEGILTDANPNTMGMLSAAVGGHTLGLDTWANKISSLKNMQKQKTVIDQIVLPIGTLKSMVIQSTSFRQTADLSTAVEARIVLEEIRFVDSKTTSVSPESIPKEAVKNKSDKAKSDEKRGQPKDKQGEKSLEPETPKDSRTLLKKLGQAVFG